MVPRRWQVIFLDDYAPNIHAARLVGMHALLVDINDAASLERTVVEVMRLAGLSGAVRAVGGSRAMPPAARL